MFKILLAALRIRKKVKQMAVAGLLACDPDDLCGGCLSASFRLVKLLWQNGINAALATNHYHVFVIVDDYVWDLTATQFGFKEKLKIISVEEAKKHDYWRVSKKFTELDSDLIEEFKSWTPDELCPEIEEEINRWE